MRCRFATLRTTSACEIAFCDQNGVVDRGLAYELVARGELPAIRLGRRIVIPRVAMEELLGTPIH